MLKVRSITEGIVATLLIIASAVGQDKNDEKQKEEEAKQRIAEFKKTLKSAKTEIEMAAAISTLGEVSHPKVLKELTKYLTSNSAVIRKTTVDCVSEYKKDKGAAGALLDLLSLYKKDKDAMATILDALGKVAYEPSATTINRLIIDKETDIAVAAVTALGGIRSKSSIDPLIALLKEVDVDIVDVSLPNANRDAALDTVNQQRMERKNRLLGPIKSALQSITKQSLDKAKDWENWWRKNSSTFKVE